MKVTRTGMITGEFREDFAAWRSAWLVNAQLSGPAIRAAGVGSPRRRAARPCPGRSCRISQLAPGSIRLAGAPGPVK
jgi:hypothetical protein